MTYRPLAANQPVPLEVLESPVEGRNLTPGTLGDQLSDRTLFVFLRHLG